MKRISRDSVVRTWFMRGLESYFAAFCIPFNEPSIRFQSFLYIVGLELVSKAYLLAMHANEYKEMKYEKGKKEIESIAKRKEYRHNLANMAKSIRDDSGDEEFASILDSQFSINFGNGFEMLENMEAGYNECRYPVSQVISKKYPVDNYEGAYWLLFESTDIRDFAFVYAKAILRLLNEKYNIQIPASWFFNIFGGESGKRFLRSCFGQRFLDYLLLNKNQITTIRHTLQNHPTIQSQSE